MSVGAAIRQRLAPFLSGRLPFPDVNIYDHRKKKIKEKKKVSNRAQKKRKVSMVDYYTNIE